MTAAVYAGGLLTGYLVGFLATWTTFRPPVAEGVAGAGGRAGGGVVKAPVHHGGEEATD